MYRGRQNAVRTSLLRMTEGDKCSGKPWDGPGSDWFSVRTLKTLLIGQSVTSAKYERTAGSWRETNRKELTAGSWRSHGETVLIELQPWAKTPQNHITRTWKFAVVAILSRWSSNVYRSVRWQWWSLCLSLVVLWRPRNRKHRSAS